MGRKPTKHFNLPRNIRARVQRSGRIYYYYDKGGKPRQEIPLGSDYLEAIKKWANLEANQSVSHTAHITFRHAAEKYLRDVIPHKARRTQKDNLAELAKLYEFFDSPPAPLATILPIHIRQYLDWRHQDTKKRRQHENKQRLEQGRPRLVITGQEGYIRANREKALFSHIWNKAREWGLTDRPNPCLGIKGYQEKGRQTYIDDETFQAVWRAADDPTRDAMDIAYLTGQRPADILKLSIHDIKENALWVTQNKTGTKLRIVIEGQLKQVIERVLLKPSALINRTLIINEQGQAVTLAALRKRFEQARKKGAQNTNDLDLIGRIQAFQFRDLRAKAGTDKEDSAGMSAAKDLLAHSDESMTKRYVRHRIGKLVKPTK